MRSKKSSPAVNRKACLKQAGCRSTSRKEVVVVVVVVLVVVVVVLAVVIIVEACSNDRVMV